MRAKFFEIVNFSCTGDKVRFGRVVDPSITDSVSYEGLQDDILEMVWDSQYFYDEDGAYVDKSWQQIYNDWITFGTMSIEEIDEQEYREKGYAMCDSEW